MARGQESQMAKFRKEDRSMLILPQIKEENGDNINGEKRSHNNIKSNAIKELKHDLSTSKLLKINKNGTFIEQKELMID